MQCLYSNKLLGILFLFISYEIKALKMDIQDEILRIKALSSGS